jgi:1,4-dihydroxy-2-naphthoate octaprenyltransferase
MTITQFNRIVEIRTKIISMGTFTAGVLYAAANEGVFSLERFLLMAAAVLFVDMGTTGFNSYFDFIHGTDTKEYNLERDKVLVHDGVEARTALLISLTLFGLAGVIGIILAYMTSFYLLVAGAVSMAVGFLYTGGPLPISRTPLGELFAGGFLGSVLFIITYYVLSLKLRSELFIASIPFLLLIALILTVNNTCDIKADKAAGRKTLSILITKRRAVPLMRTMIITSYLTVALFSLTGIYPVFTLGWAIPAFLFSMKVFNQMEKQGFSLETKGVSMGGVSKIYLVFVASFSLGMATYLLLR